jgi:hypothetical protein
MTPDLPDDLKALLDLARDYLRTREDLRRAVAVAGRALAALADWAAAPVADAPGSPSTTPAPPAPAEQPRIAESVPAPPPVPIAALPPLTFAPPPVTPPPHPQPTDNGEVTPQPLPVIATRCRLKARACRLVVRQVGGSPEREAQAALIHEAGTFPDCFLWMLDGWGLAEPAAVWDSLAGAFDAAAEASDMLALWWDLPEPARSRAASDVLHLAAEAQGVLYAAVASARRARTDPDQVHLFVTIRQEAARLRVFISRYLKREDRADPSGGPDVVRRVRELMAPLRRAADAGKNRHKALANLRYKTKRLREDAAANAGEWPRVTELLEELVTGGLPPSNAEVRDLVLPVLDLVPDELVLSPGAERVFQEVDRYLATRPAAEEPQAEETISPEVAEVRELLAGRQVVLIGGQVRPARRAALIEAFGLADLDWIATEEHSSVSVFEAPIARPEVAVVLLAIRWSSHSYGEVREFCDRFGKLLVRLPGGYHPNQVAHQILTQVGHRLRAAG